MAEIIAYKFSMKHLTCIIPSFLPLIVAFFELMIWTVCCPYLHAHMSFISFKLSTKTTYLS